MNAFTIEPLEARIAPATLLPGGKGVTYKDVDGDLVTVTVSKGTLSATDFTFNNAFDTAGPQQLQLINFSDDAQEFAKANLTFSVKAAPYGDGLAHVGFISAKGVDLGTVTVKGDLGRIEAGDDNPSAPGAVAVKVQSLGVFGASTQAAGGTLRSFFTGGIGSLVVTGDVDGAEINAVKAGDANPTFGSITIGGSLLGHDNTFSGQIYSAGDIGIVKIGHDVRGGGGASSGQISASGKITSVTIGGGLYGGSHDANGLTDASGAIISGRDSGGSGDVKSITIGDSLTGGSGKQSGYIMVGLNSPGTLGSLVIGDDVLGGSGQGSGSVSVSTKLNTMRIAGDVHGGSNSFSGFISATNLGVGKIGGSILGGAGQNSGNLSVGSPTSFTVGGSLVGGSGPGSGNILMADAGSLSFGSSIMGGDGPGSGSISMASAKSIFVKDSLIGGKSGNNYGILALSSVGTITIGGDIRESDGGAGYQNGVYVGGALTSFKVGGSIHMGENATSSTLFTADRVGSLQVAGDVIGTDASPARFRILGSPGAGPEVGSFTVGGRFEHATLYGGGGTVDGVEFGKITIGGDFIASRIAASTTPGADGMYGTTDDSSIELGQTSKIASIIIKGQARGTVGGSDSYGIIADSIGTIKIGSVQFPSSKGSSGIFGVTGDLFFRMAS